MFAPRSTAQHRQAPADGDGGSVQADVLEAMDALEEYREKGGQDAESWFAEHEAESGSGETANSE